MAWGDGQQAIGGGMRGHGGREGRMEGDRQWEVETEETRGDRKKWRARRWRGNGGDGGEGNMGGGGGWRGLWERWWS